MMILQVILSIIVFFVVKCIIYNITEKGLPDFINYQPFNCYKCFSFWTLITLYIVILLSFSTWAFSIAGIIITILDAIALTIDEKNNTISIKDI